MEADPDRVSMVTVPVKDNRFTTLDNLRRLPELIQRYSSTGTKPLAVRAT